MNNELIKIYQRTRLDVFSMAITHLLIVGVSDFEGKTDEQCTVSKGNGLMTAEFCTELNKTARDIANAIKKDPSELFQFVQFNEVFDTYFYGGQPSKEDLRKIINLMDGRKTTVEEVVDDLMMDEDVVGWIIE